VRPKLTLMLSRRDGVDAGDLDQAMATEAARLDAAYPHRLSHARALRLHDEPLEQIAAGEFSAGTPFDGLMAVALDEGGDVISLSARLEGFSDRLKGLIDPKRSGVMAGSEHVVLPGAGPLLVLINNRRLPNFDHDGFIDYWFKYHGPFAREHTPPDVGLRYRQFHADVAPTRSLARLTGLAIDDFDGAAECYYAGADRIRDLMGQTEVVDQATADERGFVDHQRCVTTLFQMTTPDP
jgi:hypothetical protein